MLSAAKDIVSLSVNPNMGTPFECMQVVPRSVVCVIVGPRLHCKEVRKGVDGDGAEERRGEADTNRGQHWIG